MSHLPHITGRDIPGLPKDPDDRFHWLVAQRKQNAVSDDFIEQPVLIRQPKQKSVETESARIPAVSERTRTRTKLPSRQPPPPGDEDEF